MTQWGALANTNGGNNLLGLQNQGSFIEQTLSLRPNANFSVSFEVSQRINFPSSILTVYCNNDNVLNVSASYYTWQVIRTPSCQADSTGEATIKFINTQCLGDCTVFIDNMHVQLGNGIIYSIINILTTYINRYTLWFNTLLETGYISGQYLFMA
jgi:hypothetical protein